MKKTVWVGTGLALLFLLGRSPCAQNWPSFRGAMGSGVVEDQDLPADWELASNRNVAWRVPIPGLSHSSPIIWEGRVFLLSAESGRDDALILGDVEKAGIATAADLVPHRWRLFSLDLSSGQMLWSRIVHEGRPRLKRHVKASHSSQTPATNGERIVALLGAEGLFCFDMQGELIWKKDIGLPDVGYWGQPEYQWGAASSPVIYRNLVFVQNDRQQNSFLAAYDLTSGDEVWKAERNEKPSWATPLLFQSRERTELITNSGNYFRGYDPETGRELWRLSNHDREVTTPSPIGAAGLIVITGGYPAGGNPIVAVRPGAEGEIAPDAGSDQIAWKIDRGSPYTPTPLAYRGLLYVPQDNGILGVYTLDSGETVYRNRLGVGAAFSASPVAADGKIFFPSEDGVVFVLAAGRQFELLARNEMGEALMASPAISEKVLVIRGRNHLFAIARN